MASFTWLYLLSNFVINCHFICLVLFQLSPIIFHQFRFTITYLQTLYAFYITHRDERKQFESYPCPNTEIVYEWCYRGRKGYFFDNMAMVEVGLPSGRLIFQEVGLVTSHKYNCIYFGLDFVLQYKIEFQWWLYSQRGWMWVYGERFPINLIHNGGHQPADLHSRDRFIPLEYLAKNRKRFDLD